MAGRAASSAERRAVPRDRPLSPALRAERAEVRRGPTAVFSDVSFSVASGEFVAVLGPNGAGKSTLLHAALGLIAVSAGRVEVLGQAPGAAGSAVGYLPQRRVFDASTRVRGVDLVRLGLDGRRWGIPLPGARSRVAAARVQAVIEQVGASGYAGRPIGECSGGEQQRLLIAQALVREPRLLLLDEPLDGLDLPNQAAVAALAARVAHEAQVAVLLVAHDVNPLLPYLDQVLYLAGGRAAVGPPEQVITSETLSALYDADVEVLRTRDGRLVVVGQPEGHAHHGPHHVLE